ncbi:MAG TPA: galactitol-1-phosphate 5-dehydrogenase [Anaerolineaceae bacterium]
MKAAVMEGLGQIFCRDVERPIPAQGEVLMKVQAASICGSDVSRVLKGHRLYPLILGHEVAGEVVEVGPGADPRLVGTRAAMVPLIPCMKCSFCQQGLYSSCTNYSFLGSRRAGGFADYVALPAGNLLPLPDSVDFETGALIEPATVARHAIEMGRFIPGQTAAVLGAGSVGLMAVQWLRILGAEKILVVDVVDENLECARQLGAHVAIHARQEDVARRLVEETGGGPHLALELAGSPQTLAQGIHSARPRGSVVLTGNQPKEAAFPAELMETITRKELGVYGTWMSYSAPFPGHEWTETMAAMQRGDLRVAEMISHRYALDQVEEVFQGIASRAFPYRKIMLLP